MHGHGNEESGHDGHGHDEESHDIDYIWKGCLVLLGAYIFYLLEVVLHGVGDCIRKVYFSIAIELWFIINVEI